MGFDLKLSEEMCVFLWKHGRSVLYDFLSIQMRDRDCLGKSGLWTAKGDSFLWL